MITPATACEIMSRRYCSKSEGGVLDVPLLVNDPNSERAEDEPLPMLEPEDAAPGTSLFGAMVN